MTELILHIGMPKTATTSIQRFLESQRDRLAEFGIAYPRLDRFRHLYPAGWAVSAGNGNDLVYAFWQEAGQIPQLEGLTVESAIEAALAPASPGISMLVVSHEGLLDAPNWAIERLMQHVPADLRIRAILYIRDQIGWLASDYGQHLRSRNARHDIATHVGRRMSGMSYARICERWARVLSRDNLVVRLLSPKTIRRNIAYDFFASLGRPVPAFEAAHVPSSNVGLGQFATEMLYCLNTNETLSDTSRAKLRRLIYGFDRKKDVKFTLDEALSRVVAEFYRRENDLLCEQFLSAPDAAELRRRMDVPVPSAPPEHQHAVELLQQQIES